MTSVTEGNVDAGTDGTAPIFGSYPYRALKGEQPKDVWKEELYHNSAKDNHDFQVFGES
jgi:hypothetical protein